MFVRNFQAILAISLMMSALSACSGGQSQVPPTASDTPNRERAHIAPSKTPKNTAVLVMYQGGDAY